LVQVAVVEQSQVAGLVEGVLQLGGGLVQAGGDDRQLIQQRGILGGGGMGVEGGGLGGDAGAFGFQFSEPGAQRGGGGVAGFGGCFQFCDERVLRGFDAVQPGGEPGPVFGVFAGLGDDPRSRSGRTFNAAASRS
jgi:hypothetical protein